MGGVLVVLLVFGLVAWALRGTRIALEYAEAFAFQRMDVTRIDERGTRRFHYVTTWTSRCESVTGEC